MELFFWLLGAWVLSPVALIPAVIVLGLRNSSLNKEVYALRVQQKNAPTAHVVPTQTTTCSEPSVVRTQTVEQSTTLDTDKYAPPRDLYQVPHPAAKSCTAPQEGEPYAAPSAADARASSKRVTERRPAVSPVAIILGIGAVFILLAGLIFATTTWRHLPGGARVVIIGLITVTFFGASWLAESKLHIRQTGRAFFVLGCLFIPVTMLALGYFELFGPWFSPFGRGRYLLGMIAALAAGIACLFGVKRYQSPFFAWLTLGCDSLSIFLLFCAFYPSAGLLSLLLSLYSALLMLLSERMKFSANPFSALTDRLRQYAVCNLLLFGAGSMLFTYTGWLPALSSAIFALLFLSRLFDHNERGGRTSGVALFTLFWMVGAFRLSFSSGFDRMTLFFAAASAVVMVLGMLEIFSQEMRRLLSISFGFCAGAALLATLPAYYVQGHWSIEMLCSSAILTAMVTYLGLRGGEKGFLLAQPVFLLALLNGLSEVLFPASLWGPFLSAMLAASAFLLVRLAVNPKNGAGLRSVVSDLLFSICCLARGIQLYWGASTAEESLLSLAALLMFCMLIGSLVLEPSDGMRRRCAVWLLPHMPLLLLPPVGMLAASVRAEGLLLGYLLFLGVAAIALLLTPLSLARRLDHSMGVALSGYTLLFAFCFYGSWSPIASIGLWLLAIYCGIWLVLTHTGKLQERKKPFGTNATFFAGAVSALLASWMTALYLWPAVATAHLLCAPAALASVSYLGWLWLRRHRPNRWLTSRLWRFAALSLTLCAVAVSFANWSNPYLPAISVLECVLFQTLAYHSLSQHPKARLARLLPLLWVYPLLLETLTRMGYRSEQDVIVCLAVIAAFLVLSVTGRLFTHGWVRNQESPSCDWFAVINLFAPLFLLWQRTAYWRFGGWLLMGLWAMLFYRRTDVKNSDHIVMTAASAALCAAYWSQPFWFPPAVLEVEWALLAPAILSIAIRRWIWVEHRRATGVLQFGFAVAGIVLLGLDAAIFERPADALILGGIALVMLLGGYAMHLRRWFALASSTLLALAIYMTRGFWLSLAWWIYLLAVGLLLIAFASVNELYRQRGESLSSRIKQRCKR